MHLRARRRLAVVVPAVAAILGVTAIQSGAAEACGRWLFGDNDIERTQNTSANSTPGSAPSSERASSRQSPGASSSAAAGSTKAQRGRAAVLTVTDGAQLGTVKGRFVLAGASSLPSTGKVAFDLRGPSSVTIIDGRAPYKVAVDPRRMKLRDGEYSVSVRLDGSSSSEAVATLVVQAGGSQGSREKPSARPTPTVTKPTATASTGTRSATPVPTTTRPRTIDPRTLEPKTTQPTATRPVAPTLTVTRPVEPTPTETRRTVAAAKPTTESAAPAPTSSDAATEVIRLTNVARAARGCRALTVNAALTRAAQGHSEDMAAKNYFAHASLDGRSPFDRMKAAGYSYRMAAENIAAGQRTPQAVVTGWMNSEGHRLNIENCDLTEIGVGVATGGSYGIYWTQNFGTPR